MAEKPDKKARGHKREAVFHIAGYSTVVTIACFFANTALTWPKEHMYDETELLTDGLIARYTLLYNIGSIFGIIGLAFLSVTVLSWLVYAVLNLKPLSRRISGGIGRLPGKR